MKKSRRGSKAFILVGLALLLVGIVFLGIMIGGLTSLIHYERGIDPEDPGTLLYGDRGHICLHFIPG